MASDWGVMTLRDAGVELIDCEHKTPTPAPAGFPYVAIPQMREGRIDLESARRISEADFIEWTRKANPRDGDVVLSRRTNPGETGVAPPGAKFALGQNLVLLRSDGTHVDSGYLRWLVRSPAWWGQIQRHLNVGAVFDSLKCADVPNFELPIPPLPERNWSGCGGVPGVFAREAVEHGEHGDGVLGCGGGVGADGGEVLGAVE